MDKFRLSPHRMLCCEPTVSPACPPFPTLLPRICSLLSSANPNRGRGVIANSCTRSCTRVAHTLVHMVVHVHHAYGPLQLTHHLNPAHCCRFSQDPGRVQGDQSVPQLHTRARRCAQHELFHEERGRVRTHHPAGPVSQDQSPNSPDRTMRGSGPYCRPTRTGSRASWPRPSTIMSTPASTTTF